MTNPNNAIGTNGAYGGRTSVNAFNDNLAIYQGRGVLSGFAVSPNTGMSVAIGGDGTTRDVAIAEDNIGNKTTINNISESPISLTIAGAPASNSRIDAIVAYVDNPAQGSATEPDNPSACGLLDVQGSVSATPSQPDENTIRTAITADGASGTTAYYVVLGYITVASGTTDITSNMINKGNDAVINTNSVADGSITTSKLNDGAVSNSKLANGAVSNSKIANGAVNVAKIEDGAVSTAKVANGAITSDKIDWATINYGSTTEDVVVGVYNGKPVYRHAEEFTISSSGWTPINLTRPISNFGKLINVFGSIRQAVSGGANLFPLYRVYGVGLANVSNSAITFDIGTDVSGQKDIIVFIDYTKSTD